MTSPNRLADSFNQQAHKNDEVDVRQAVSAKIVTHDGTIASVTVDSFDGGVHVFNQIPYEHTALPAGASCLVQADENGTYWIVAP